MENIDLDELFEGIEESDWELSNSQATSEVLQMAEYNITNCLPYLKELEPPSPVFINDIETGQNKAIYCRDYKMLREFIRSNKDLTEHYYILLPIEAFGTLRYDPRYRNHPAILYFKDLIK